MENVCDERKITGKAYILTMCMKFYRKVKNTKEAKVFSIYSLKKIVKYKNIKAVNIIKRH